MSQAIAPNPLHRATVEHMVRAQVYERMGLPVPQLAKSPNPLLVNVSARHCHLSLEAVEQLFGPGRTLTPMKWLYQKDQFAAQESVTLIGPRSRVISNLRILGPCRDFNQIELAYTDSIALGFAAPLRLSGDIEGSPGCLLMGPHGSIELDRGVIRAAPHVHMHPDDAAFYGVQHLDTMKLRAHGPLASTFEKILVRVDPSFKLEVHIDTDEGNACGHSPDTFFELLS